jgi:peptidoglycan hydrolase FlgJ
MAVSLPSDLIMDVMRNADPSRVNTVTAKLQDLSGDGRIGEDFANLLDGIDGKHIQKALPMVSPDSGHGIPALPAFSGVAGHRVAPDPYVDFERMVLRNLLESLLPDAGSGAFGKGPSAGVWRTMAADQLAGLYASSGGIGIAETLAGSDAGLVDGGDAQWPYFRTDGIKAFTG